MSFVPTPNSVASPLNPVQSPKLITQNVKDPVVQQNLEILNRYFGFGQAGSVPLANLAFGPAFGTTSPVTFTGSTSTQTPGALQVQIATRGNPVRVKLAPFQYQNSSPSIFELSQSANESLLKMTVGWLRSTLGGTSSVTISQVVVGATVTTSSPGGSFSLSFPLPAFEFDDVVPSGIYTYQFFYQLAKSEYQTTIQNINAVAYELG